MPAVRGGYTRTTPTRAWTSPWIYGGIEPPPPFRSQARMGQDHREKARGEGGEGEERPRACGDGSTSYALRRTANAAAASKAPTRLTNAGDGTLMSVLPPSSSAAPPSSPPAVAVSSASSESS